MYRLEEGDVTLLLKGGASLDINTAFDKTDHAELIKAQDKLHVPTLANIASAKDYQHKTATITISAAGTTKSFKFRRGGWQ